MQPEGRWAPKAFVGEVVPFAATVFREGHGLLWAELELTSPDGRVLRRRMRQGARGTDLWHARAQVDAPGEWSYRIRAASDDWASWLHDAEIKVPAGLDVELVLETGALLLRGRRATVFRRAVQALRDTSLPELERLHAATSPELAAAIQREPVLSLVTASESVTLRVERERAGVGAWYEFFPRSEGARRFKDGTVKPGNLRTAQRRLPAVAAMGFEVLYLPPIHPIGESFRKGRNNSTEALPGDPGSPWAIGSAAGGHDTVHPELGTLADFRAFVRAAAKEGIEVAMDFALQASPDHPWVREHPEWFTERPDGSIAYAENPPKKYQDIYPINFDRDPEGIRAEALRLLEFWIGQGVRIFRVDNPHTKPLDFWEWLIGEVNAKHPEVVFLAEAFTRPAMMRSLAGAGFQQSYSYFTWRNTKEELTEFFESISDSVDPGTAAYLRPNLFVNTPDILTEYLQFGGRAAYKIRAALAATASPNWGVYAGYELFEHVARPGSEENLDNEKYEIKVRDWAGAEARGDSLAPYLTMLNRMRGAHPALRQLRNLDVHWSDDDAILVYSKHLDGEFTPTGKPDTVIVVVNLDPHSVRQTTVYLDPTRFGLDSDAEFDVIDEVTGSVWNWSWRNYVRLDAFTEPVHLLTVDRGSRA